VLLKWDGVSTLNSSELATLQRLVEDLWVQDTRFDRSYMEEVFAEEFYEFGRSGRIYSREETLSHESVAIAASLPLEDFKAQMVSDTVALVTYNSAVTYDGEVEKGRRSSLWVRSGTTWKLRFHQGTPYK